MTVLDAIVAMHNRKVVNLLAVRSSEATQPRGRILSYFVPKDGPTTFIVQVVWPAFEYRAGDLVQCTAPEMEIFNPHPKVQNARITQSNSASNES